MQEKKRKQAETERKRAEVRARLEEASKAKKAKKGFMTPDRKKKLRVSPAFCFFPLEFGRTDEAARARDVSSLKARSRGKSPRIFRHISHCRQWKRLMPPDGRFTKVCFVSRQYRCRIECSLSTTKSSRLSLVPPIYLHCLIARHNLLRRCSSR